MYLVHFKKALILIIPYRLRWNSVYYIASHHVHSIVIASDYVLYIVIATDHVHSILIASD